MARSAFYDLFDEEEAANLELRAQLMDTLQAILKERFRTQQMAADFLKVGQSRISDLYNHNINVFSLDMLINMLTKLGKRVEFSIQEAA